MLKMLQLAVVGLGVAFFLALAGLAYYSSSPTAYPTEHQTTTQSKEKQPQEKRHTLGGFINFLFPDAISIFTFWLVIATVALGVIAYVQIEFFGRAEQIAAQSAGAAKESADTAKNALVAANRPWIKADISVGGPVFYNVNGMNFTLRFILKNVGHSPATNIWVEAQILAPALGVETIGDS